MGNYNENKVRQSNFELLRIVGMLAIVAHHYVSGSGIMLGFEKIPGGGGKPSVHVSCTVGNVGKNWNKCFYIN
ncbi:MAG: hypothetical protein PUE71_02610 [Clostridia bacterium]|nr:hypothetical protein [Clostridia bacterium]